MYLMQRRYMWDEWIEHSPTDVCMKILCFILKDNQQLPAIWIKPSNSSLIWSIYHMLYSTLSRLVPLRYGIAHIQKS